MTRYEFLHRISEIVAPKQTQAFFNYLLDTSEDCGNFFRTGLCRLEKPLPDSDDDVPVKIALVILKSPYDFERLPSYYKEDGIHTNIKLQIHFGEYENEDTFYFASEWANAAGFSYPVKIDMEKGAYERSLFWYEKNRHRIGQPRYSFREPVCFHILDREGGKETIKEGVVRIVDAFGTFGQHEEPSYDIEVTENNKVCLYKHIRESDVLGRYHKNC